MNKYIHLGIFHCHANQTIFSTLINIEIVQPNGAISHSWSAFKKKNFKFKKDVYLILKSRQVGCLKPILYSGDFMEKKICIQQMKAHREVQSKSYAS